MEGPRAGPGSRRDEQGFTLIELLVVIIIIAILAAIAIPMFLSKRERSYDAAAKSDLKQLALQEESNLVDQGTYDLIANLPVYKPTAEVTVTLVRYDADQGYCLTAKHSGSSNTWVWDSRASGLQPAGTVACPTTTTGTAGDIVTG